MHLYFLASVWVSIIFWILFPLFQYFFLTESQPSLLELCVFISFSFTILSFSFSFIIQKAYTIISAKTYIYVHSLFFTHTVGYTHHFQLRYLSFSVSLLGISLLNNNIHTNTNKNVCQHKPLILFSIYSSNGSSKHPSIMPWLYPLLCYPQPNTINLTDMAAKNIMSGIVCVCVYETPIAPIYSNPPNNRPLCSHPLLVVVLFLFSFLLLLRFFFLLHPLRYHICQLLQMFKFQHADHLRFLWFYTRMRKRLRWCGGKLGCGKQIEV